MIPFNKFILPKIHASIARGSLNESVDDIDDLFGGGEKLPEGPSEEIPYLKQHFTRIAKKEDLFNDHGVSELSNALSHHYQFVNPEHKDILARYTGSSYKDGETKTNYDHAFRFINGRILGLGNLKHIPGDDHKMQTMDEALRIHQTPHELTTYSGLSEDHGHLVASNDRVHHPAYLSTSLNPAMATGFAGHQTHGNDSVIHMMQLHIPAGHSGAFVEHITRNPGEHEFVMPRGTTLRIDHSKRQLLHSKKAYSKGDMYTFVHHAYPETK